MEQLMKIGNPKFYDSVAKTDKYGKSIEHLLSQHPDTEFLIVPHADGHMVSAVSTIAEEPEIEEEDERKEAKHEQRLPRSGSGKPKDSGRKSSRRTKR